ncbi:MAG: hypothetical protein HKN52_11525 [Eudoraea sp.]|nr:hypothetical protein [Eudoraea sp.]NNL03327.1 hypothetical protein [Eudoraea sp.]
MFSKLGLNVFKLIKIYGASCIFFDMYMSMFGSMETDPTTMAYTFGIEGLFILLKSSQIEIPLWVEVAQDLV